MIDHRLHKAEQLFWANSKTMLGPATISQKLEAWQRGPSASACFDSSTWTATKTSLHRVRRWELRWVRKLLRLRRRPEEGRMQFNTRTSKQLKNWFHQTGTKFLHQRILQAIHKSAWREGLVGGGLGEKLLLDLRTQRCRMIWDVIKSAPISCRRAENMAHARPGSVCEWEDVLVQHYGHDWRHRRDECTSCTDWQKGCDAFINATCTAWNLPPLRSRPSSDEPVSAAKDAHSSRSEPDIDQNLEIPWESQQGRFLFVVDCQPLQRLACGHTGLLNEQFRPPLYRIVDNLAEFIAQGLLPPSSAADPVLWAKRHRNSVAD